MRKFRIGFEGRSNRAALTVTAEKAEIKSDGTLVVWGEPTPSGPCVSAFVHGTWASIEDHGEESPRHPGCQTRYFRASDRTLIQVDIVCPSALEEVRVRELINGGRGWMDLWMPVSVNEVPALLKSHTDSANDINRLPLTRAFYKHSSDGRTYHATITCAGAAEMDHLTGLLLKGDWLKSREVGHGG